MEFLSFIVTELLSCVDIELLNYVVMELLSRVIMELLGCIVLELLSYMFTDKVSYIGTVKITGISNLVPYLENVHHELVAKGKAWFQHSNRILLSIEKIEILNINILAMVNANIVCHMT